MFSDPEQVAKGLMEAGAELLYVRDPGLAAALDVPASGPQLPPAPTAAESRPRHYRLARKLYRAMWQWESLRVLLTRWKEPIQRRLHRRK